MHSPGIALHLKLLYLSSFHHAFPQKIKNISANYHVFVLVQSHMRWTDILTPDTVGRAWKRVTSTRSLPTLCGVTFGLDLQVRIKIIDRWTKIWEPIINRPSKSSKGSMNKNLSLRHGVELPWKYLNLEALKATPISAGDTLQYQLGLSLYYLRRYNNQKLYTAMYVSIEQR